MEEALKQSSHVGRLKNESTEEKALAEFGLTGHSENHIQSALSIPFASSVAHSMIGLTVR